ncbi:MAG: hypothetical protein AABX28_02085 [Nanoarchaeota archaeon]
MSKGIMSQRELEVGSLAIYNCYGTPWLVKITGEGVQHFRNRRRKIYSVVVLDCIAREDVALAPFLIAELKPLFSVKHVPQSRLRTIEGYISSKGLAA